MARGFLVASSRGGGLWSNNPARPDGQRPSRPRCRDPGPKRRFPQPPTNRPGLNERLKQHGATSRRAIGNNKWADRQFSRRGWRQSRCKADLRDPRFIGAARLFQVQGHLAGPLFLTASHRSILHSGLTELRRDQHRPESIRTEWKQHDHAGLCIRSSRNFTKEFRLRRIKVLRSEVRSERMLCAPTSRTPQLQRARAASPPNLRRAAFVFPLAQRCSQPARAFAKYPTNSNEFPTGRRRDHGAPDHVASAVFGHVPPGGASGRRGGPSEFGGRRRKRLAP